MFRDATSGANFIEGWMRSSMVMKGEPPLVRFRTAFVRALICGRNLAKASGDWSGLPVTGSRACWWMMAAPASAAPTDASIISSGVTGR